MIRRGSLIEVEKTAGYYEGKVTKIFFRGACLKECDIGEETEIRTVTGHFIEGTVSKNKPFYNNVYDLGKDVREILMITKFYY